jgi:hypothetical protein
MRILHFVEATGTDETAFPASSVTAITLVSDQGIRIWFERSDNERHDDRIDVTTVSAPDAEILADYFAEVIAQPDKAGILTFTEGSVYNGAVVNTIAHTAATGS